MAKLIEKRIVATVRLTNNQKAVMTKIVAAPTEKVAADEISSGRELVTARDMLVKMGLIEFRDGYAALTTDGTKILKDSNLVDDMDALTDEGQKHAATGEEPVEPTIGESLLVQINNASKLS